MGKATRLSGVGSPGPPGSGFAGSLAPNVIAATCTIGFQAWGDATQAVFGGTFTCPVTVTNLAHLIVRAFNGPLAVEIARFDSGFTSSGVIAYSGASNEILETGVSQTGWAVRFECYDANYLEAASPFTVSGLTIPAATITAISATDEDGNGVTTDMSWVDAATAKHAVVKIIVSGAASLPMNLRLWIDKGQGAGKEFQGWDLLDTLANNPSQAIYIGAQRTDNGGTAITISASQTTGVLYPPTSADQTWTVYAAPLLSDGSDPSVCPSSAVSYTFTMHKTAAPADIGIVNATCGPSTTMGPNSEGIPYWSVPISFTTPGMGSGGNQNCRGFALTVNITDSSGNEAPVEQGGGEVIMAEPPNDGSTYTPDPLVAPFNPAGSIYTYVQFKVYAPGLDVGDSWNTGTRTLQSIAWNGGSAVTSVLVNFGQPPDGMIPLTRVNPATILREANPGNPALCLQLSNPANLAPGQTPCGPFSESNVFTTASGQVINGTRGPLGPNFGSDTMETTIGNSSYNSLQVTCTAHQRATATAGGIYI